MAAQLFRQEALAHQAERHWGNCTGLTPVGLSVLAWLLVLITLTLAGFLVTGTYQRKSVVPGILVADLGIIQVRAPVAGMVAEVAAGTGERVGKGEYLLGLRPVAGEVNGRPVTRQLLDENRRQEILLTRQREARTAEYTLRREQLAAEHLRMEDRGRELAVLLAAEKGILNLLSLHYQRLNVLVEKSMAPSADLDKARMDLLKQESVLQQARLELAETRQGILAGARELQLLAFEQDREGSELARKYSELRKQTLRLQAELEVSLPSPVTGTVAVLLVEPGATVVANEPLVSLLPEGTALDAELRIPSRAMGFMHEGLTAHLRLDAYPYQKFGMLTARIRDIARVPVMPADVGATGHGEPYFRVIARLDEQAVRAFGDSYPLRPGMQFQADVVLERRSLLAWLLEPLLIAARPV